MLDLTMRTRKTAEKYKKFRDAGFLDNEGCRLCKEILIKKFKHWKIIRTRFPWDRIAKVHHMLIPKRHITYEELSNLEKIEYDLIKRTYLEKKYQLIAEATSLKRTIPAHMHLHLIILKNH